MNTEFQISCPISGEKINENVARLVALQVVIIASLSLIFNNDYLSGFLVVDFFTRVFIDPKYSLLSFIGKQIVKLFHIKNKPTDWAPKRFAAGLGLAFSATIFLLQIWGFYFAAQIIGGMLIFCACLEAFFSYCVGCVVYTYLNLIQQKIK